MTALARRLGEPDESVERFALAGLLHDADWERDPGAHPAGIVAWCRERGIEDIAHAISAHGLSWGVPHLTTLDCALVAADEPAGLVLAVAKVNPSGLEGISAHNVMKKFKIRSFAAGISREEVIGGATLLGWPLPELFEFIVQGLRPHASELGIGGDNAPPRP